MTPRSISNDVVYGTLRDSEFIGDCSLRFASSYAPTNILYDFFRKFLGVPVGSHRILNVVTVRGPFEVGLDIVRHIVVVVGDFWKSVRVRYESDCYETVAIKLLPLGAIEQQDPMVAVFVNRSGQDFSTNETSRLFWTSPAYVSVNRSNAAKIADFVKSFVAFDRLPLLHEDRPSLAGWRSKVSPMLQHGADVLCMGYLALFVKAEGGHKCPSL